MAGAGLAELSRHPWQYEAIEPIPLELQRLWRQQLRRHRNHAAPGSGCIALCAISPCQTTNPSPLSPTAFFAFDLRQEPYEVILQVRICAGGRRQRRFQPRSSGTEAARFRSECRSAGSPTCASRGGLDRFQSRGARWHVPREGVLFFAFPEPP